jgi:hypothetical protein
MTSFFDVASNFNSFVLPFINSKITLNLSIGVAPLYLLIILVSLILLQRKKYLDIY